MSLLRRALSRVRRRQPSSIPYDMFNVEHLGREARAAKSLERVYHQGQERIWDGREILSELVEKHGGVHLPEPKRRALQNLFSIILWGELAAWKISAELAAELEPLEARLAATSQAHDEARHFYVMHDYLKLIGYEPAPLPGVAGEILDRVLRADTLAKKLVGMQLMIEPIALTLFTMARRSRVEPVLCELLPYYERDEARHVTLGVQYLPTLLKEMNWAEALDYWLFQARMFALETRSLRELRDDFAELGFPPREAFRLGQGKQLMAVQLLADELNVSSQLPIRLMRAGFDFAVVYNFPEDGERTDPLSRLHAAARAAWHHEAMPTELVTA
ncbi:MAG: ferritin-like domain-containing protein [Deltaproteobacteria bacterium]|nr:MAG: ferritin-like domain-containing protein [Deltaproteobacteria bacterium]